MEPKILIIHSLHLLNLSIGTANSLHLFAPIAHIGYTFGGLALEPVSEI
jgi:hypothetical protein